MDKYGPSRVLLVDDEYYFRKLLVNLIDWSKLGFEIAGEAEDGIQALEMARTDKYDLIIADINMPRMTGLDFVEQLRGSHNEAKIIFITSYDVFAYAKAAVTLGASYYLLKPVDEDELVSVLSDIREELIKEVDWEQNIENLKKQVERTLPVLRTEFVRQFLLHEPSVSVERIQEQAHFYNIPLEDEAYTVILVEIDELNNRFSKEQERQLWRFAVKNVCEETFQPLGACCVITDGENNHIAVLAGIREADDSSLQERCEQARKFIDQALKIRSTLAIGGMYEGLHQVHLSYSEALYALKHKFIDGGNRVIAYRQEHVGLSDAVFDLQINRNDWLMALRQRDREALDVKIASLCERLVGNRTSKEMGMLALMECISLGSTVVLERGGTFPNGWMTEKHPLFHQIRVLETVADMRKWLQDFFDQVVFKALSEQMDRSKSSEIVNKAIDYIYQKFPDDRLSLQQTARDLFVNPSYLSHIFKKETGKSFIEFLTDARLDKAAELLRGAASGEALTIKLAALAHRVGYTDPLYFSKCFKKKFGISPSKAYLA
jgi:two-component system response regulator YesN